MLPLEPLEVQGVLDKRAQISNAYCAHISLDTDELKVGHERGELNIVKERVWISLHTDGRLGSLGVRGDAELSGASLVLSCYPENVGEPLQQTFNIHLSVRDDVPEDVGRREH